MDSRVSPRTAAAQARSRCLVFSQDAETRRRIRLGLAARYSIYESSDEAALAASLKFLKPSLVVMEAHQTDDPGHEHALDILRKYVESTRTAVLIILSDHAASASCSDSRSSPGGRIYTLHDPDALAGFIQAHYS